MNVRPECNFITPIPIAAEGFDYQKRLKFFTHINWEQRHSVSFLKFCTKIQKTLIRAKYLKDSNTTTCFRFFDKFCNKDWATFTNRTSSGQVKPFFSKTLTEIQKALIGAKYWWIPLSQRVLTSFACTTTNSEKPSQIELRPDKWNQESWIRKPSPKFRKHCSEQITWWILMKRSVLALLICTATNYEQLSQTKLRLDIQNQVFTKTLTKTPENTDRSKILDESQ